ncbi:MAG: rubredoxin [Methylococcaceae bacterium]|jgi:Rubredoxin
MSEAFFASAYGGNFANLPPETRLECKICWHVYDPEQGDEFWQIAKGTPFSELPEHWSCPECGSKKQDFLVLDE